jgi:hypothetical protein
VKAITTKFHGPTSTHGPRISATDNDGNRATIPYDYGADLLGHLQAVKTLCKKMGWKGQLVQGAIKGGLVWVWADERDTYTV